MIIKAINNKNRRKIAEIKNTYTACICFFWVTSPVIHHHHHHHRGRRVSKAGSSLLAATAGVVGRTRITHQRETATSTVVNLEVSTVIKPSITRATHTELVFVTLHSTLISSKFKSRGVLTVHNRRSSSSPVVSRSHRSHRSSLVSESGSYHPP